MEEKMSITTAEEAKKAVSGWLKENGQEVQGIEDDASNFHFETSYPLGSMKKQRILQPKNFPGLCVLLNGVTIADEHKEKLKKMTEEERDKFYGEIKKDLVFVENSYEMDADEHGIVRQIQFSYEFYFDALTKTQLYRGLLLNHRILLYIVIKFNEKFGIPTMPGQQGDKG
jgi:hypothetical protein